MLPGTLMHRHTQTHAQIMPCAAPFTSAEIGADAAKNFVSKSGFLIQQWRRTRRPVIQKPPYRSPFRRWSQCARTSWAQA